MMYVAMAATTVYGQVREVGSTNEGLELRESMFGDRGSFGAWMSLSRRSADRMSW